jgi:ABC-2 type transport system ATP-binding protein
MLKINAKKISIGKSHVLSNVNFEIKPEEIVLLIGKNGSGKSTLIKYMLGLIKPFGGSVLYHGNDIFTSRKEISANLGALFVNQECYGHLSVIENLKIYATYAKVEKKDWDNYLKTFNLTEFKDTKFNYLSSGNKQKTNLALLFLDKPDYIFLDEPFLALDRKAVLEIKEILTNESQLANKTILIATHDFVHVEDMYTRVLFLQDGQIKKDLKKNDVELEFGNLDMLYQL